MEAPVVTGATTAEKKTKNRKETGKGPRAAPALALAPVVEASSRATQSPSKAQYTTPYDTVSSWFVSNEPEHGDTGWSDGHTESSVLQEHDPRFSRLSSKGEELRQVEERDSPLVGMGTGAGVTPAAGVVQRRQTETDNEEVYYVWGLCGVHEDHSMSPMCYSINVLNAPYTCDEVTDGGSGRDDFSTILSFSTRIDFPDVQLQYFSIEQLRGCYNGTEKIRRVHVCRHWHCNWR